MGTVTRPEQKKGGNFGDNFRNLAYISEIIPKVTYFFLLGVWPVVILILGRKERKLHPFIEVITLRH